MSGSYPLFCPKCGTVLVDPVSARIVPACPACGLAAAAQERDHQKTALPFELEQQCGLATGSGQVWVWGVQTGRVQLIQINPRNSRLNSALPAPHNWQVGGLAANQTTLVFAPWEPNPPGNSKGLAGIHPTAGNILWEFATSGFMLTSPATDDDLVCASDSDGRLVAVHASTGKAAWKTFPSLGDFPHSGIPPVLSNDLVLAVEPETRGAGLVAFSRADGGVAWVFHPPEGALVDFAPTLAGDFAFVLAGEWLYRVALKDGTWNRVSRSGRRSSQGWYFAQPVVDEKVVFLLEATVSVGKPAYALRARDPFTGQALWQMELARRPYQPPAISAGFVFFVDRDGELFCLDKTNGQVIWQESLSAEPVNAPIVVENTVFVLTRDANLHSLKLSSLGIELTRGAAYYETLGEWTQAAGVYLAASQPFEAGLALLENNDFAQARLAFNLSTDPEHKIRALRQAFARNKNDSRAGEISADWGMVLLEQLGERAQGNKQVAGWFEQAAEYFMLANQAADAANCREKAAQVMEIPRIKLEVAAGQDAHWVVDEAVLLQIRVTNIGFGPARRVSIKVEGNLKKPYPTQTFLDLAINQTREWENVRIIPNSPGPGLLEFMLEYLSYRTDKTTQTKFIHPIQVEKNQDAAFLRALKSGTPLHIEKFFSPGATHNEIEVSDSQGIVIGDQAPAFPGIKTDNSDKENPMDPVTLIITALVGGLTIGVNETAKAAAKDIYDSLKSRLMKKTEKSEDARDALEKVEKQPDSKARQELLKEELGKLPLGDDQELLKLAQSMLDLLKQSGDNAGKYKLDIQNSQGIVVGDNSNVTQNFGDLNAKRKAK